MLCVERGKREYEEEEERREEGKDLKEKQGSGGPGQKPTVYRPRHKIVEDVGR
jgi:hypothetical protein